MPRARLRASSLRRLRIRRKDSNATQAASSSESDMVDSLSADGRGNVSQGRLVPWGDKARFMR